MTYTPCGTGGGRPICRGETPRLFRGRKAEKAAKKKKLQEDTPVALVPEAPAE